MHSAATVELKNPGADVETPAPVLDTALYDGLERC